MAPQGWAAAAEGSRAQKLHVVGIAPDHNELILSARRGAKSGSFVVTLDDDLWDALDAARAHVDASAYTGERQPEKASRRAESSLSVKEVQARIRAGRSIEEVAAEAGVEPGWVRRFAVPVQAEQVQIVSAVRAATYVKLRAEPSTATIGEAVHRNLAEKGVACTTDEFDQSWSARQLADGVWVVAFTYVSRGRTHRAAWEYDEAADLITARGRLAGQLAYRRPAPEARRASRTGVDAGPPRATRKVAAAKQAARSRMAAAAARASARNAAAASKVAAAKEAAAKKAAAERARAEARAAREKARLVAQRQAEQARRAAKRAADRARAAAKRRAERERAKDAEARARAASKRRAERERAQEAAALARAEREAAAAARAKAAAEREAASKRKPAAGARPVGKTTASTAPAGKSAGAAKAKAKPAGKAGGTSGANKDARRRSARARGDRGADKRRRQAAPGQRESAQTPRLPGDLARPAAEAVSGNGQPATPA